MDFVTERLNGDDGLGGIYPAIANSVMMFDTLGFRRIHRRRRSPGRRCGSCWSSSRPSVLPACLSPVWDTGLAGHAMAEAGAEVSRPRPAAGCCGQQILEVSGDW